jgi:hypothetical protein
VLLCVKNIKAPLRLRNADYQCSALGPRSGFARACCTVRCGIERLTGDLAVALALEGVGACSGCTAFWVMYARPERISNLGKWRKRCVQIRALLSILSRLGSRTGIHRLGLDADRNSH